MNRDGQIQIDDNELLRRFYEDDNNYWLGQLLDRYTMLLLGVCLKYLKDEDDAKDAVQQIFLKVIAELKKYKVEYFKSWLYKIAKNQCLMTIRNRHGRIPQELHEDSNITDQYNTVSETIEKDKTLTVIEQGLNELKPEHRVCVTLFYLHKKSYHEITSETGFNLLQVKSYIQNGKRNLKLIVEKKIKNG